MAKKNIKIFVSCHKPSIVVNNDIITPIQVGTALAKNKIPNILYDNVGDNISAKNRMYCELTAQYWAWKNIQADYYGFFHYRRYLSFADKKYKTNFEGIVCNKLNDKAVQKFGLDEKTMHNLIEEYDVIAPNEVFVGNLYWQYCAPTTQNKRDLDFCLNYIYDKYPEMKNSIKKSLKSSKSYICNMFIMKKEIFQEYCNWLFDVLFAHEKACKLDYYDVQSYRVSGYLAERLCGLYLKWLKEQKEVKFKELQRILISQTDDSGVVKYEKDVCPVLININNKTWLDSLVLINSIIKHSSSTNNYALLLNDCGLKEWQKKYISRIKISKNINIRLIKNKKLAIVKNYQDIAKELNTLNKIIILSPNCVVNSDIYELYQLQTSASVIGARDMHNIVKFGKIKLERQEAKIEKLKPYSQLSYDVTVLNLSSIRLGELQSDLLPAEWCVEIDEHMNLEEKLYAFAPHYIYNQYYTSRHNPKLIAYHGKIKPLNNSMIEGGDIYWDNANVAGL